MFRINKKLEYALMVIQYLTDKVTGNGASAREISSRYQIPFDTTSKVMQLMSTQGILRATQGSHGGYSINKDLNSISFLGLAESILGPIALAECLNNVNSCHLEKNCNIISPLFWLNQKFLDLYKKLSIKELLHSPLPIKEQPLVGA